MSEDLIPRASGDDVVVPVLMRRSSFEKLASDPDGRSVDVSVASTIGLIPAHTDLGYGEAWTFVVWSPEPVFRGVPEQIPGNEAAAEALRAQQASP